MQFGCHAALAECLYLMAGKFENNTDKWKCSMTRSLMIQPQSLEPIEAAKYYRIITIKTVLQKIKN
jgi:hypothetical protein